MRIGREAWILGILLLVFIAFTAYFSQGDYQREQEKKPTTYSGAPNGLLAVYRLFERQGMKVARLEQPLTELKQPGGLLVLTEPVQRRVTNEETAALWRWIENGGTCLIFMVGGGERVPGDDPTDKVTVSKAHDIEHDVKPATVASPYLRDVASLHVRGGARLYLKEPKLQQVLAEDADGPLAVTWQRGKGRIVLLSDGLGPYNDSLASNADNAVLLVNIAQASAGRLAAAYFDEYHQGFGWEDSGRTVWEAVGAPARTLAWFALAIFAVAVYNANRRFGTAKSIQPPTYRASTEYIASMATLYRRAGGGDIAIETIYKHFARDLAQKVDAPPDAPSERVAELAQARFGIQATALLDLMARGRAIASGQRVTEAEALRLARQMEDYRRRADLVRA